MKILYIPLPLELNYSMIKKPAQQENKSVTEEAISMKRKETSKKAGTAKPSPGKASRVSAEAYGDNASICVNADCTLRKKAGGCFGFEGCPGFKSR